MNELEKQLLDKVVRKRDLLARSIQRVCTQIESMVKADGETVGELEAAKIDRDDLDKKLSEFNEVQSQIEMDVEDDKLREHEEERTRIETIARSAKIVLAEFIAAHTESGTSHNSSRRQSVNLEGRLERKVKRPEIQIPKFEGDFLKWNDFKNVFESLVVNETAYSNVEKMVYLKQAVQKSAADVIKKFEITEKNFEKAWDKLRKRYENRRATINNHLQALTQLPAAKTEAGLQKLVDAASDAIESLDAMGISDGWPYMVSYLVTEKLDPETRKAWEIETVKEDEYPRYEILESFLQQRVRVIESMGQPTTSSRKTEVVKSYHTRKSVEAAPRTAGTSSGTSTGTNSSTSFEVRCFECQENHVVAECKKFAAKSLAEKTELIKKRGLCFQCLNRGHMVLSCKAPRCSKCGKRHHILLHVDPEKPTPSDSRREETSDEEKKKVMCTITNSASVILPSASVYVEAPSGKKIVARALLDSCSEINLITENLSKNLRCIQKRLNVSIETLAPGVLSTKKSCRVKIKSLCREFSLEIDFLVVPHIIENYSPYESVEFRRLRLDLADSSQHGGNRVDMLIGAEFYETIMLSGKIKIPGEPYLRETLLGWVAIGSSDSEEVSESSKCFLSIKDQLQSFFVLEEVGTVREAWTSEERRCDDHYEKTHVRDSLGFEVGLPKEMLVEFLGESRYIAFRQFCALERRLSEEEKVVYTGFMHEYIDLKHMTLVEKPDPAEGRCFLPHHAVYKKTSTTSKMRSVFNASSPTSTGYSLNDILMKGPVLQDDLFSIIIRFRCVEVAVTADIEKMYRQVRVKKEDRKLQCILWRDHPDEPIRTYELNTVTYGTKPASFLATKCLFKLAEECEKEYPETAAILRRDFYMDDVLTGGSSVGEVRERLLELRQVLASGGFPLRKFASNSEEVLQGLSTELVEGALEFEKGEQNIGVLGMRWLTKEDRFAFYARFPEPPKSWTKREILSEVSRIFDPLGLLAPVTITFKIMLQSLWLDKIEWDKVLNGEILDRYLGLRSKLAELPSIQIPRFVGNVSGAEIHVFCDASERAFGAAVYLRTVEKEEVRMRLLCAKTRVAPVKKISLPRLELCGAVLAAKLFKKVREALKVDSNGPLFAWTDSTIVLSWLAKPEHSWCTFVANRITKVLEELPIDRWNHVRSQENAADVVSRGIEPDKLDELESFLIGPKFLQQVKFDSGNTSFDSEALCEEKRRTKTVLVVTEEFLMNLISKFSSYSRLIRVVAYVIRFYENSALSFDCRTFGNLSTFELARAKILLIKQVQATIDKKKLEKIDHFVDNDGILRLRGRISNAELSDRVKYPILVPKGHFCMLLIEHCHVKFYHANCTFLKHFLNLEYYFIAGLSRLIRSVIYKCVTCRRFKSNLEFKIPEGQLPEVRVNASPAFAELGVDFAGPFTVRAMGPSGNRGRVFFKSYVAVFVCMVTKACHLEVVEDLSSKCFLDALSRVIARRGMFANVYSDHGTNFVGADRELKAAFDLIVNSKDEIQRFAADRGFTWHFIPQRAPNFGGLWEAAVKSFKSYFKKVVGTQILSYVELVTLSVQIEAILNSRPICASDSSLDCFISPAHLCIGRSLMLLPELPGEVVSGSQFVRYKLVRGILDRFWACWHSEYLVSLRKATLRVIGNRVPVIGELVLIKDETSPPSHWPVARIIKLFTGKDGIIRVADVKLGNKIFRRPIIKLVPLLPEDPSPQGPGVC